MAQHPYTIVDQAGAALIPDLNALLAAVASQNSGSAAPTTTFAYMWWLDTTTDILKIRNAADDAWIELFHFDYTNGISKINFDKAANIASTATTNLGAATGNFVHITGTTTIAGFGAVKAGTHRWVVFDGVLTLTHNATSLILPGGTNITTASGDTLLAISEGSGNWRVLFFEPAAGTLSDFQEFTSSGTYNKPAGAQIVLVEAWGGGGSGGKANTGSGGAGGGGGSYISVLFDAEDIGASETVTIGAGGASKTIVNTDGDDGGTTTFGSLVTAYGGGGGADGAGVGGGGGGGGGALETGLGSPASAGARGGQPNGGLDDVSTRIYSLFGGGGGGDGGVGGNTGGESVLGGGGGGGGSSGATGGVGGNSVKGGGGGGGGSNSTPAGSGGTSTDGGNGGNGAFNGSNASNGVQPGGGGGGTETGNSGAGGAGLVRVWTS